MSRQMGSGAALLVVLVVAGAVAPRPAEAGGRGRRITAELRTDSRTYAPGQPVAMTLVVTNTARHKTSFRFTSGQRYDFRIRDEAGKVFWTWSSDRVFIMVLGKVDLEGGAALKFMERYEGDLPPGRYTIVGDLTSSDRPLSAAAEITVE